MYTYFLLIIYIIILSVLEPLAPGASTEKLEATKEVVKHGGLGIITAAIFLAGEMAGSGVLALPAAMIGTGEHRCNVRSVLQVIQNSTLRHSEKNTLSDKFEPSFIKIFIKQKRFR